MTKYIFLFITILFSCDMKNSLREPKAEKIQKELTIHGDTRIDEYYWLNQRDDKKVIDYLNAENSYRDNYMKDYKNLEEEIFLEIKSRINEDDSSVPYLDNGYYYYTRYEKDKQYPIYCRKKGNLEADEEILINAFHKNDDIHSLTARLIFEKEEISSDERRVGKTINFGVIYGMGIKKFARSTGVSTPEAKEFLIKYKERYSKIFKFLELQERLALSKGYVKTIFGRKREFKFDKNGLGRLLGKDPYEIDLQAARRAGMEAQSLRAAANAPIQGSSADIIKIAMVQLNKKFIEMNVPAKMLLQVHDELLFEVEPDSLEITMKLVKNTMEDCVKLNVPLLVDIGIGDNWMETK